MSHTPQDDETTTVAPSAAERDNSASDHHPKSTPAKKKYGPDLVFTSNSLNHKETLRQLSAEMEGHWLGAMPPELFLHKYLKTAENSAQLPPLADDPFKDIPSGGVETSRYGPFVSILYLFPSTLLRTHGLADTRDRGLDPSPEGCEHEHQGRCCE